jgi:hypothetical protein
MSAAARGKRPASSSSSPSHHSHSWLTIALLVSLAPVSILLGILISLSDAVSRVLGHRGSLLPRPIYNRRQPNSVSRQTPSSSQNNTSGRKRALLITGSGPLALAFARLFSERGWSVVVCDGERIPYFNRTRYSSAVKEFVPLRGYFFQRLLGWRRGIGAGGNLPGGLVRLVKNRNISFWLPLESSLGAQDYADAKALVLSGTQCKVLGASDDIASLANDRNDFEHAVKSTAGAIQTPKSISINTRGEIHRLLGGVLGSRRYLLSRLPILNEQNGLSLNEIRWRDSGFSEPPYSDSEDKDSTPEGLETSYELPLSTLDKTYDLLASISVSSKRPWSVTEILKGKPCQSNCLVIGGELRAFAGFRSSGFVSYPRTAAYVREPILIPIDQNSPLYNSMRSFTKSFISTLPEGISTPLNLNFLLEEKQLPFGAAEHLWVLSCSFYFSTSILPFDNAISATVNGIVGVSGNDNLEITASDPSRGVYSLPPHIIQHLIVPILRFLTFQSSLTTLLKSFHELSTHFLFWREELFDWKDPAPFLWFWIIEQPVYTTLRLLSSITGWKSPT